MFWYDYETTGIVPSRDRPLQVAGIRTDAQLNEIDTPVNLYCRLSDDILPHPAACLVTGIDPARLRERGLSEAEFMSRVQAELGQPGTCGAGYNSLRFDDEVTRYSLYRNFHDPYAREWQGGNSRWDLIDLVRTAYALRPDGIEWPRVDGQVSLKLELLTAANGIEHGQAHDALSDVRATIALARLLRERQPRLYDWAFELRNKHKVIERIQLMRPMVHVSGRFGAHRNYLGIVLPLGWHPRNRNALIVCDLSHDPQVLWEEDSEVLSRRLYTRRDQLEAGQLPVPLKLIHVNRCPVIAPLGVIAAEDRERLQLDFALYESRVKGLHQAQHVWAEKLERIYASDEFLPNEDPEQQLYDGFIGERDRRLCHKVVSAAPEALARETWMFEDPRLPELLFRYRARNYPHTLDEAERERWLGFCRSRLGNPAFGAPHTLASFDEALAQALVGANDAQRALLTAWQQYVNGVRMKLQI
nr:exodeoxyribonuclease I [Pseudomonas sp. RIT-PI-S]